MILLSASSTAFSIYFFQIRCPCTMHFILRFLIFQNKQVGDSILTSQHLSIKCRQLFCPLPLRKLQWNPEYVCWQEHRCMLFMLYPSSLWLCAGIACYFIFFIFQNDLLCKPGLTSFIVTQMYPTLDIALPRQWSSVWIWKQYLSSIECRRCLNHTFFFPS